jgi:hypothetical protein
MAARTRCRRAQACREGPSVSSYKRIDPAQQMARRNSPLEIEQVKQLALIARCRPIMPNHPCWSPLSTESSQPLTSSRFFNTIGQLQPSCRLAEMGQMQKSKPLATLRLPPVHRALALCGPAATGRGPQGEAWRPQCADAGCVQWFRRAMECVRGRKPSAIVFLNS